MKVCILIPVFNESKTIGQVVDGLKKKNHDVFVVDDGSTDNSGDIAKNNGAFVIRNENKSGKGYSIRRGFNRIVSEKYDGVIILDGDGQHNVNDVDKFLDKVNGNKDIIVVGNRMNDSRDMPFIRYLTNKFMSALISSVCKQTIPDTQCGYRYVGCDVLDKISLSCDEFEFETEILIKAAKKYTKISSVVIETIYRNEVSKINPFKDTIRFIIYFLKEIFAT
ncbi:MAG: glycosyltransferase family 2 protein [Candidatus Zapsychrus exili]|nr:glycosyltransferase family 2 protein [Candidatus Zapsychrus exili]